MKKVVLFGALPESLINFRGPLIKALTENNDVTAIAAESENVCVELAKWGVKFFAAPISRNGLNPLSDSRLFVFLVSVWARLKPSKILAYTIKPVIWGGLAARFFPKIEFYALITGLGYAFEGKSFKGNILRGLVVFLYRVALRDASAVIFQNNDNKQLFLDLGICKPGQAYVVNGTGVDTKYFDFTPIIENTPVRFLMIARILKGKGVLEYAEAANIVKRKYPNVEFDFVGPEDPSPDGLKEAIFSDHFSVNYMGEAKDVRSFIQSCSVYVLPSYHEGVPRSSLEAMAMGRPVLTTSAVGCKETVVEGENGFMVPIGDAKSLADKMIWFVENLNQVNEMGQKSRQIVEERFDVQKVNTDILNIMGLSS